MQHNTLTKLALATTIFSTNLVFASDFTIERVIERATTAEPSVCLVSNKNFDNVSNEKLKSFITLKENEQNVALNLNAYEHNLCFTNLKHGAKYEVLLKKGLTTDTDSLTNDLTYSFDVSDSSKFLSLENGTIIPTSSKEQSISFETINLDKVHVRVYAISDKRPDVLTEFLNFNNNRYRLSQLINKSGTIVYEADLDIKNVKNEKVVSTIDLKDFIKTQKSNLFIVSIIENDGINNEYDLSDIAYNDSRLIENKYVIATDLSLITYKTENELLVQARSYADAKAQKNTSISLISQSGEVLAEKQSDENGFVSFEKELISGTIGNTPSLIIGKDKEDISIQNLNTSPLYLNANKGNVNLNTTNVLAYTGRDLFRVGEDVNYTAVIRDEKFIAKKDLPFILEIKNPKQSTVVKEKLTTNDSGLINYTYKLNDNALFGNYSFNLYLSDKLIDSHKITVNDFIPAQITLSQDILNGNLSFGQNTIKLNSLFNYGAKASNIATALDVILTPDNNPIEGYEEYFFGINEVDANNNLQQERLSFNSTSDKDGISTFNIAINKKPYPIKAKLNYSCFDTQNQNVTLNKEASVLFDKDLIGIKETKKDNGSVAFNLISLTPDGNLISQNVSYALYKEQVSYNYVFENGTWQYLRFARKVPVSQGNLLIDNNQDNQDTLSFNNLENGNYILELNGKDTITSYNFYNGFRLDSNDDNTPWTFDLLTDKKLYSKNDNVKLSFNSAVDGFGSLVIKAQGSDKLITKNLDIKKGENVITVDYDEDLYPSAYALLNIYSPYGQNIAINRALGIAYIDFAKENSILKVKAVNDIKKVKANSKVQIPISIENSDGKDVYVEAHLIDVGILNLLTSKSSNLNNFIQRRIPFSLNLFDTYNRLIASKVASQNEGYGEMLMNAGMSIDALKAMPTKSYALYSGIVKAENGNATLSFDIPNFYGALKLSVNAFSEDKLGSYENKIVVSDNATTSLTLPRYLLENDKAKAKINLHNINFDKANFKINATCSGAISCKVDKETKTITKGNREDFLFDINANALGVGSVSYEVSAENYKFSDTVDIEVKENYLNSFDFYTKALKQGEKTVVQFNKQFKEDAKVYASVNALPYINDAIYDKVYKGFTICLDDYLAKLDALLTLDKKEDGSLITDLIDKVLTYQDGLGNFTDAGPYSSNYYKTLYAYDVLTKARNLGFNVPDYAYDNCYKFLINNQNNFNNIDLSYFYYLMSQKEAINIANLRYLFDDQDLISPFSYALMYVTFNNLGDFNRAKVAEDRMMIAFENYQKALEKFYNINSKRDYWQLLSEISKFNNDFATTMNYDVLFAIKAAIETKNLALIDELITFLDVNELTSSFTSMQTIASAINAQKLMPNGKEITLNNNEFTCNEKECLLFASIYGKEKAMPENSSNGIKIEKVYYDKDGNVLDTTKDLKLNDEIVVTLKLQSSLSNKGQTLVEDIIPACFEYERNIFPNNEKQFSFAKQSATDIETIKANSKISFNISNSFNAYNQFDEKDDTIYISYLLRVSALGTYNLTESSAILLDKPSANSRFSVKGTINTNL